jgi:hypothetical protein
LPWAMRLCMYNLCTCLNSGLANKFSSWPTAWARVLAGGLPRRTSRVEIENRWHPVRLLESSHHPSLAHLHSFCHLTQPWEADTRPTKAPFQLLFLFSKVTFTHCVNLGRLIPLQPSFFPVKWNDATTLYFRAVPSLNNPINSSVLNLFWDVPH